MDVTLEAVEIQALQLPLDERAELIERLLASVEPPTPLHPEWEAAIARRLADLDAGRTALIPAEEALDRLARHIRDRRLAK